MNTKRLDYLDITKGIAIILIVMGHAGLGTPNFLFWLTNTFHMPLFFIVSGILISFKKEENKPFSATCMKKCKQLLTPYFIFCGLNILLVLKEFILDFSNHGYIGVLAVRFIQTFTLSGISVLWFLPALLLGELLFLAILNQTKKTSAPVKFLTLSSTIVLIVFALYFMKPSRGEFDVNGEWLLYFFENIIETIFHTLMALCFLIIGYLMQSFQAFVAPKVRFSQFSLLWATVLLCISKVCSLSISPLNTIEDLNNLSIESPIFFVLNAVVGTIFILCVSYILSYLPIIKEFFTYCGKNSLIIMVTHLDCYILLIAFKVDSLLSQQLTTYPATVKYSVFALTIIILEVIIITIINRFFPFVIGQKKRKSQNNCGQTKSNT